MVYELTNSLLINRLLEMAKVVPDVNVKTLEKMLVEAITSKLSKIFVEEKGDEIRGFLLASVEELDGEDVIFIQFCVIKPMSQKENNVGFELLNRVRLWGRDLGINYIYAITKRSPKGYIRKYGFEYYANLLRKKIAY